jgi:putative transposase
MSDLKSYISEDKRLSIRKQCQLLDLPRSNVYYQTTGESQENLEIMKHLDEHSMENPTYGVIQMQDFLFALGYLVNIKRVRRLLRKMGILAIYPRKNLSKLGHVKYIRPYLLRNLEINRPNQVWAIDITYIPMASGFMYLTAIIDVYSRYIVGWGLSNNLEAENSLIVLKNAISEYGLPEIINSDQGSQFTCALWTEYIEKELEGKIKISMDGKGRATDNIYIERFWRTLKRDYIYLKPEENGTDLFFGIKEFIDKYNHQKTHQGINRKIPVMRYKNVA